MKPSSDREAISSIISGLTKAGVKMLSVVDGANEEFAFEDKKEALDNLTSCDESVLNVLLPDGKQSHIYFVLGNDPEEVACDYGVSLSPFLDPIIQPWWN